jgi:hypothetical protein
MPHECSRDFKFVFARRKAGCYHVDRRLRSETESTGGMTVDDAKTLEAKLPCRLVTEGPERAAEGLERKGVGAHLRASLQIRPTRWVGAHRCSDSPVRHGGDNVLRRHLIAGRCSASYVMGSRSEPARWEALQFASSA